MGRRLVTGVVAGLVLIGAGGCGDDGGGERAASDDPGTTEVVTPTTGASTSTTAAPSTEAPTTEGSTTSTAPEELDIPTIQAEVEADHPDEARLIDWTLFSWISIRGYTAPVQTGTTPEQGVEVCEALAEVLDAHADPDPIHVVIGPDAAPWAYRATPDSTCA